MLTSKAINQSLSQAAHNLTRYLQQAQTKVENTTQTVAQKTDQVIDFNHKIYFNGITPVN